MSFKDTLNKATIRRYWDFPVLSRWKDTLGRELTYFGLPGEHICDLLDWQRVLARKRTGVESPGHTKRERALADETIGNLNTNVMVREISSGFQLLIADVEDVILEGYDKYGNVPQLSDGRAAHHARFSYDVVNLDFDGGLGYRSEKLQGMSKRVAAIKKLFERQAGHSFVLFLTVNVRHKLGDEIEGYLRGMKLRERDQTWGETLSWYLERGQGELDYKLKAIVPSFIQAVSELQMFRCTCRPPVVYEGHERARMMHFVMELEAQKGSLRAFSQQDEHSLLNMPLVCSEGGGLRLASRQNRGFSPDGIASQFDFLPADLRNSILVSLDGCDVEAKS